MEPDSPRYTEAELQRILDKQARQLETKLSAALREQQSELTLASLKDQFAEMRKQQVEDVSAIRKEISDANHIKQTLGRDLAGLLKTVSSLDRLMRTHINAPFHPGGAEKILELEQLMEPGLAILAAISPKDQKQLPAILQRNLDNYRGELARDKSRARVVAELAVVVAAAALVVDFIGRLLLPVAHLGGNR